MADWLAVPTEASKVGFKLLMFGPVLDNGPVGETATLCDQRQKKNAVSQLPQCRKTVMTPLRNIQ